MGSVVMTRPPGSISLVAANVHSVRLLYALTGFGTVYKQFVQRC